MTSVDLKVGDIFDVKSPNPYTFLKEGRARVMFIIRAGEEVPEYVLLKANEWNPIHPLEKHAIKYDRFVCERQNGSYLIFSSAAPCL